jgi:hypothetical protein
LAVATAGSLFLRRRENSEFLDRLNRKTRRPNASFWAFSGGKFVTKSGWIVLLGIGLIVAGCSGEPANPPGKGATPATETKTLPVAKEPAAAAPEATARVSSEVKAQPEEKAQTEGKAPPEGKGGSVPGAMGKALLKAIATPSKSKEQKAADEAPPFRP